MSLVTVETFLKCGACCHCSVMFVFPMSSPGGMPSPQMPSMYGAASNQAPMMGMPYASYPMMPPSPQMGMPYPMMSQHGSPMHSLSSPRFPPAQSSRASSPRPQLGSFPSQPGSGPSQPGSGPRSQPRSNPPPAHALPIVATATQVDPAPPHAPRAGALLRAAMPRARPCRAFVHIELRSEAPIPELLSCVQSRRCDVSCRAAQTTYVWRGGRRRRGFRLGFRRDAVWSRKWKPRLPRCQSPS